MKAIAIGGPRDGHTLESEKYVIDVPTADGSTFTYGWHSCARVYYWTSPNEDMPLSVIMRKLVERYGQFRDFASGKTLEVINGLADKVQELETADAGAKAREQNLRDELEGMRAVYTQTCDSIRDVRHRCACAGFKDEKLSVEGLVHNMAMALDRNRIALEECKNRHNETIDSIRAELKSTGHKHEGRPLADLVDIAIDTERTRHEDSLKKIGDACGISFAIGNNYFQMADVIVNSLRSRFEKKLVAMQAKPAEDTVYAGAAYPLEQRVAALEKAFFGKR